MPTSHIPVPRALMAHGINGFTTDNASAKTAFHSGGRRFLVAVAQALGLPKSAYDVSSNLGGPAVSGEVVLHSDELYLQLFEGCTKTPGVHLLYRTCDSRKDYCGHQNHLMPATVFSTPQGQTRLLDEIGRLVQRQRQRVSTQSAA